MKGLRGAFSDADDAQAAGPGGGREGGVVGRHDDVGGASFPPQEGGGEVNGIERSERCRKRLGGAAQDDPRRLHDFHFPDEPKSRLPVRGELFVRESARQPQTIQRSKAFHLDHGARHSVADGLPLFQFVLLAEDDPKERG